MSSVSHYLVRLALLLDERLIFKVLCSGDLNLRVRACYLISFIQSSSERVLKDLLGLKLVYGIKILYKDLISLSIYLY